LELERLGISCQVGRVSTERQGEEDQVWCGEGEDNRRPEIHAKLRAARSVPPSQRMDVAQ
ncbi:MAG: hypothetical protein M1358_21850, partial [Chloroflexi bacterium]|nr:hypothetical protein [Chloroflexota bacterium]